MGVGELKVLSLFAGIGGFDLGLERTGGFETVAFCEIEPFAVRVLNKHWPKVPVYGDVRELTADRLGADGIGVDIICGGFPCQDISVAGDGLGLAGERSGLWREYARLIREIRPSYVIVENVAALLCRGLGDVLGDLAASGYDAEWDCIPAAGVGAPHLRDRVWIVAYPREERTEGRWQGTLSRLSGVPWRENVRRAAEWARRPDLPASGLCRGSDGVPARVDRAGALGNAVHTAIPELIGWAILASLEQAKAA
jgi:DNA (cytosine-5)-methyltransferase 1